MNRVWTPFSSQSYELAVIECKQELMRVVDQCVLQRCPNTALLSKMGCSYHYHKTVIAVTACEHCCYE